MQVKADINNRQWERGEFPILCEKCFGDNPYVRMQKHTLGGTCKMCDRPYTLFKWRPGRGEPYRRTEICQTCSRIKNLCQTCILDLEFGKRPEALIVMILMIGVGLPSQLRDAVLSQTDGTLVVPESDANREYFAAQHSKMITDGTDPWSTRETPNEKLLEIVRNIDSDREQPRVKLPVLPSKRDASALSETAAEAERKHARANEDIGRLPFELHLPPGVSSEEELRAYVSGTSTAIPLSSTVDKPLKKPPKPSGPPPASAFVATSE